MILPHQKILDRCLWDALVFPWTNRLVSNGMTYGIGPAGYDVRIAQDLTIESGEFKLASIIEHINMPEDLLAQVCDKSTWARLGLAVQNTILEPGWFGYLTLELTNHSRDPISIIKGTPICQIIFMLLQEPTDRPYIGKYQNQENRPIEAILEGGN